MSCTQLQSSLGMGSAGEMTSFHELQWKIFPTVLLSCDEMSSQSHMGLDRRQIHTGVDVCATMHRLGWPNKMATYIVF